MSKLRRLTNEEILDGWRDDKICHNALDHWATKYVKSYRLTYAERLIADENLLTILKSRIAHHAEQETEVDGCYAPPADEL